ncbi:MAG TPA: hypothetical protein DCL54_06795 [Alphaproteobacteria bacterium]|nr:hypothetical protein [Alphaproteobacteria bacterium]HAJ46270.1 hypothetical protein [Alphaproteobacteria bacterium]
MSLKDRMEFDAFKTQTFIPHHTVMLNALGSSFVYELDEPSFHGKTAAYAMLSGNQFPALEKLAKQIGASAMVKEAFEAGIKKIVLKHEKDVRSSWDGMAIEGGTLTIRLDWEECYLPDDQLLNQLTKML